MDSLSHLASNSNPPRTSGVYKITCVANKKIYIGSTINLCKRKEQHFRELRQNKHHNPYLQNAWNKYGEQVFVFEVLELVLIISLTAREQYWFNKLKPFGKKGFNIASEAGSTLGRKPTPETLEKLKQSHLGKKHTPEHLEKMRGRKHTPEAIEKIRQAGRDRKLSPESIERMRQAAHERKYTPEGIEKIRLARTGRKQTPESIEKTRSANLGRKHTSEAIEKMRQAKIGKKKNEGGKFV